MVRMRGMVTRWAAVLVAVVSCIGVVSCSHPRPVGYAPMPPATAGPSQVVLAYIQALNENDPTTAKALISPSSVNEHDAVGYWLDNIESIRDVQIFDKTMDVSEAEVAFNWTLKWRDPSYLNEDGREYWSYILEKDTSSGRWLISDEGQG